MLLSFCPFQSFYCFHLKKIIFSEFQNFKFSQKCIGTCGAAAPSSPPTPTLRTPVGQTKYSCCSCLNQNLFVRMTDSIIVSYTERDSENSICCLLQQILLLGLEYFKVKQIWIVSHVYNSLSATSLVCTSYITYFPVVSASLQCVSM